MAAAAFRAIILYPLALHRFATMAEVSTKSGTVLMHLSKAIFEPEVLACAEFRQFLSFGFCFDCDIGREYVERQISYAAPFKKIPSEHDVIKEILIEAVGYSLQKDQLQFLGISSGLDSRAIGYAAQKLDIPLQLYTFGMHGMLDFDFAELLEHEAGLQIERLNTSTAEWSVDLFVEYARNYQDIHPSPRVLAYELIRGRGGSEPHGYLNGFLTGSHVPKVSAPDWGCAVDLFCKKNDPFAFQAYLPSPAKLLPARPMTSETDLSFYDQLDLGFRQAQRIRLSASDRSGHYRFPFEFSDWVGFWLSRRGDERLGQSLYIEFLKSLNSSVFFDLEPKEISVRKDLKSMQKTLQRKVLSSNGLSWQDGSNTAGGRDIVVANEKANGHFCFFTHQQRVDGFRRFSGELLEGLRDRGIVKNEFIDQVLHDVMTGVPRSNKHLNGLLSVELAMRAGRLR